MSKRIATAVAALLVVAVVAYLLACSQATWSPDGKSLAFVSRWGDKGEQCLYVSESGGAAEPRLLWLSDSYLSPPGWSPDSKTLAVLNFVALTDTEKEAKPADFARAKNTEASDPLADRLYLVSVADGQRRLLAEQKFLGDKDMTNDEIGPIEPCPQFADGGKVVVWPLQELEQVRLLEAARGKLVKQLDNALVPVVSPSGKLLALLEKMDEDKAGLAVFDLEKMERRSLLKDADAQTRFAVSAAPAWSPDSLQVLVAGKFSKKNQIVEEGKPPRDEWVEDKTSILQAVAVSDGKARTILKDFPNDIYWVAWAPKGDLLAITAENKAEGEARMAVWILKTDASGLRRIHQDKTQEAAYHPTFSPDGSKLSYRLIRKDEKIVHVVVYDVATGTEKLLPLKPPVENEPEEPSEKLPEKAPEAAPQKPAEKPPAQMPKGEPSPPTPAK